MTQLWYDHRKKRDPDEEEAALESSSEDEFYDRTDGGRKKRGKAGNVAQDAASIYGKKVCTAFLQLPPPPLVLEKHILEGYETEPWFADPRNTSKLQKRGNFWSSREALVIPDQKELSSAHRACNLCKTRDTGAVIFLGAAGIGRGIEAGW